jgi:two-component system, chemotaxis family, sensor kinase CheA
LGLDEDDIWHTYATDGAEALRNIEESMLSLETDPGDKAELNRLYRALHTLKGNSALLDLQRIERLAHAAEDMVGMVRDRGAVLDGSMVELMLAIGDGLAEVVQQAGRERRDADAEQVADLVARVEAWVARQGVINVPLDPTLVGRGQLVIWSSLPPAGDVGSLPTPPEDDFLALELFLGLCNELLPSLLQWARAPGVAGSEAEAQLARVGEDLAESATRAGQVHASNALHALASAALDRKHDARALSALAAEVVGAVSRVEEAYRVACRTPQEFGLPELYRSVCRSMAAEAAREPALPEAPAAAPKPRAHEPVRKEPADDSARADFLRVDARKVSLVMDLMGELALTASAVTQHPELEGLELTGFSSASHKLDILIKELLNEVSAMRLVPVAGVFQRMKRVLRDAARRTGKQVELVLVGEDTEIDKLMVDSLHDPLVHVVRNAVDHGIEPPEERVRLGKPETGRVVLEALHQGGEVRVRVSDDGRGLDRARILQKAIDRKLVAPDAALSDAEITALVFQPGFSTKETVDELSGRGVGMDVLRTSIEELRGRVRIDSVHGKGSSLEITLPLTLAFVESMVVRERERLFAVPIEKVLEVFKAREEQLSSSSADGRTLIRLRDSLIPVAWLHRFYGEPDNDQDLRIAGRVVVVVQTGRGQLAIPVDRLLGNQPVMLKPLTGVLSNIRAAAGCGMLRSGDVALALDCERLHD